MEHRISVGVILHPVFPGGLPCFSRIQAAVEKIVSAALADTVFINYLIRRQIMYNIPDAAIFQIFTGTVDKIIAGNFYPGMHMTVNPVFRTDGNHGITAGFKGIAADQYIGDTAGFEPTARIPGDQDPRRGRSMPETVVFHHTLSGR